MASVGERIGRYELVAELGRGGMGQVFEAVLVGPGGFRRSVALKVLLAGTPGALLEEARLGALVQHPNVVQTWEVGEVDGQWFLAMELVRGPTLSRYLAEHLLPPSVVVDVGLQLCAALAHLHGLPFDGGRGIAHRDVKPANLMVDPYGLLKLTDLGLATLSTSRGPGGGTPGYAPPEQLLGGGDHRADLFALGSTLYAIAARSRPFGSGRAACDAVLDVERRLADPEFLAPVDAAVPGLGTVVRQLLRRDPDERTPSAEAAAAALRRLAVAGPTLGTHLSPPPPPRPRPAPASPGGRTSVGQARVGQALVGREQELAALADRLVAGRLVTLTGIGGVGKTCLAGAAAERFAGDTTVVSLAECRTPEDVALQVCAALGLDTEGSGSAERVPWALEGRGGGLVVLDAFEHVLPAAATLEAWHRATPSTAWLVTSRRALRIESEEPMELGTMSETDAVALFRARSHAAEAAPGQIEALVRSLDHHPLSIELAAGRSRRLPVSALLRGLDARLRLLSSGDKSDRNRSLRASLDASGALLTDPERSALAQLSVFRGPATLQAVEAVVDLSRWPSAWVFDAMEALCDHHLLRFDPATERYAMLPTVRDWAATLGPDADGATVRHARWFAQLGSPTWLARLRTHGAAEARAELAAAGDDLRAACLAAAATAPEVAVGCLWAIDAVRAYAGPHAFLALLDAVLPHVRDPGARVRIRHLRNRTRSRSPDADGRVLLAEADDLCRAAEAPDVSPAIRAEALRHFASIERKHGDRRRAAERYRAAAAQFRAASAWLDGALCESSAHAVVGRGVVPDTLLAEIERTAVDQGDLTAVLRVLEDQVRNAYLTERPVAVLCERSLALGRSHGFDDARGFVEGMLAKDLRRQGRGREALRLEEQRSAERERVGDRGHAWFDALSGRVQALRLTGPRAVLWPLLDTLRREADRRDDGNFRFAARAQVADIEIEADRPEAAEVPLAEIRDLQPSRYPGTLAGVLAHLETGLARIRGDLEAARSSARTDDGPYGHLSLARIDALAGRWGESLAHAHAARAGFEEWPSASVVGRASAAHAVAVGLLGTGEFEAAAALAGDLSTTLGRIDAGDLAWQVHLTLAHALAELQRGPSARLALEQARAAAGPWETEYTTFRLALSEALVADRLGPVECPDAPRRAEEVRALATTWLRRRELEQARLTPTRPG